MLYDISVTDSLRGERPVTLRLPRGQVVFQDEADRHQVDLTDEQAVQLERDGYKVEASLADLTADLRLEVAPATASWIDSGEPVPADAQIQPREATEPLAEGELPLLKKKTTTKPGARPEKE